MNKITDLIKGFGAGVGVCLTLLIGIAASPTDSSVRGYLRGLVDSTASPPPLCQATNGTFTTITAATNNALTILVTTNVAASGRVDTMDLASTNSVKSAVGTFATISNTTINVTGVATVGSIAGATTVAAATGAFATLLPSSALQTTNQFTNSIGGSLTIIVDALGRIVSITVAP